MKRWVWATLVVGEVSCGLQPSAIVCATSLSLTIIVVGWCVWGLVRCARS